MLANMNKIIEDELRQQALDSVEVVERTPPIFFAKALAIIVITVLISLGVRAVVKRRRKK